MNLPEAIAHGARPSGRFSVLPPGTSVNTLPIPAGWRNLAGGKAPATPQVAAPPKSCTPAGCGNAALAAPIPRPLRGPRCLGAFPGVSSPLLLNPRLSSRLPPGWLRPVRHRFREAGNSLPQIPLPIRHFTEALPEVRKPIRHFTDTLPRLRRLIRHFRDALPGLRRPVRDFTDAVPRVRQPVRHLAEAPLRLFDHVFPLSVSVR